MNLWIPRRAYSFRRRRNFKKIAVHASGMGDLKKKKRKQKCPEGGGGHPAKEREELSKIRTMMRELSDERTTLQKDLGRLSAGRGRCGN